MPSVITSRAIARSASKLLLASPLQTMSRSVTIPISRSSSPIGMQPMSCPRINFASSVTGVLGLTQSTPLCITSLTFMADLRYLVSGAFDSMQHSSRFRNYTTDRVRRHPRLNGALYLGIAHHSSRGMRADMPSGRYDQHNLSRARLNAHAVHWPSGAQTARDSDEAASRD